MPTQSGMTPQHSALKIHDHNCADQVVWDPGQGFLDSSNDELDFGKMLDNQLSTGELIDPKLLTASSTSTPTGPPNILHTAQHRDAFSCTPKPRPTTGLVSGLPSVSTTFPWPQDAETAGLQPCGYRPLRGLSNSFTSIPAKGVEGNVTTLDASPYSVPAWYALSEDYLQHQTMAVGQQHWNSGRQLSNHGSTSEISPYDFAVPKGSRSARHGRKKESFQEIPPQAVSIECEEKNCKRRFRLTQPDMMRLCKRHRDKYIRNHAGPPTFYYRNDIRSFDDAYNLVYSKLTPMNLENDDVYLNDDEDYWVTEFIHAANTPYFEGSNYHEFHARQQTVYNGKATDTKFFNDEVVNVRMRFLYQAAYRLHVGEKNDVYPKGGDNHGYGEGYENLIFSERLSKIIKIMTLDKRVCLDVIEGRGVNAFVRYPDRYEKRKTQNKDSNEKKQKKQKLGDQVQAIRKVKGKNVENSDVDSEDCSVVEDDAEEDEYRATAAAFNTPASLNRPLDADGDYVPSPVTARLVGGKRKREMPAGRATEPTTRVSKKAKANSDEADQDPVGTLTPNVTHLNAIGNLTEATDYSAFADYREERFMTLADALIAEFEGSPLDSDWHHE